MKRRLSFFQGSSTDEPGETTEAVGEEISPAEASGTPAAAPVTGSPSHGGNLNARGIHAAFTAVAQALGSEVDSIRHSMVELDTSLHRTVHGEQEARAGAVDRVKQELASRIDAMLGEERKRLDGRVEDLKQAADRERQRVDEMKAAIEKSTEAKIEKLSIEVGLLSKAFDALQVELRRQIETSEQVTALLNNMAGVFAVKQAHPGTVVAPDSPGTESRTEVESALARVFK